MGQAGEHRPRHLGGLLVAEFLGLAAALTVVGSAVTDRIALAAATIAVVTAIVGQGSRTRVGAALRKLRRPRLLDIPSAVATDANPDTLADRDGLVAVLAIGPIDALLTTAHTTLPDIDGWSLTGGEAGPGVRVQLLVQTMANRRRVFLAVRVGSDGIAWQAATLRAAMTATVARIERRLDREGIGHRRLSGPALTNLMPADSTVREARDHVTVGTTSQVTLRVGLPPSGMTTAILLRLTESSDAATWLTWSGRDATIRVAANSAPTLRRIVGQIETTGTATRMDGEHLAGLAETLPIARQHPSFRTRTPRRATNHHRHDPAAARRAPAAAREAARLALPPSGVQIGHDRNGAAIFLTPPPDRVEPVRLVFIGGDHAARVISDRATTAGVSVRSGSRNSSGATGRYLPVHIVISVLDEPTAADAATLTAADIVVCQVLSADAAAVVATALRLSARMSAWLTRIEPGMVALIGEGAVKWAMLPESTRAVKDLAGALPT